MVSMPGDLESGGLASWPGSFAQGTGELTQGTGGQVQGPRRLVGLWIEGHLDVWVDRRVDNIPLCIPQDIIPLVRYPTRKKK